MLEWVKRGCPKESRGWYDIKAVMEWRGSTTGPKSKELSAEARKLAAEAKFKEAKASMAVMDQAVMEGKYIEKAEVDRTWATVGTQLKANIMAWVRTLTPQLAHQDMRSVEKVMTGAVYDLLEQISSKGRYRKKAVSKKAN
jgi:phage terminase Nu1 subunit (DNA packaging protein)